VGVRGPFSHEFLLHNLTENGFLSLRDMCAYGPLQWGRIRDSVFITPILREMACAYHDLRTLNEKDKEGWLSSTLVGHTLGNKLEPIARGEGVVLKHAGVGMVADLFLGTLR
jgi:hypothetical protein